MKKCTNCPQDTNFKCKSEGLNLHDFTLGELEHDLISAFKLLFKNDHDLLDRGVHENCINSYIFYYLKSNFSDKYDGYNIDPQYNRNGKETKYYDYSDDSRKWAIPDTLIHVRNCNHNNLLYIEYKTTGHSEGDFTKIKRFTAPIILNKEDARHGVNVYNYKYGVSININQHGVSMQWFECGEPLGEEKTYRLR